jgi:hypothetical protein
MRRFFSYVNQIRVRLAKCTHLDSRGEQEMMFIYLTLSEKLNNLDRNCNTESGDFASQDIASRIFLLFITGSDVS